MFNTKIAKYAMAPFGLKLRENEVHILVHIYIYMYIYIYIYIYQSEGFTPNGDIFFLGAWVDGVGMGLEVLPPPSSSCGPGLALDKFGRKFSEIWK